jgi:hypothetical protein
MQMQIYDERLLKPFWESFDSQTGWPVGFDNWDKECYNYIVAGFPPGSFHTSVFAGDLFGAAQSSHPLNNWEAIMEIAKWIINIAPEESKGSYDNVSKWLGLSKEERQVILERCGLLLTEKELVWDILKS